MSYKTVLVHVDESVRVAERIRIAAQIALYDNAHLIGAAMTGVSRFLYQDGLMDDQDHNLTLHLNFLRERASLALSGFEPLVSKLGLASFETRVADDEAGDGISLLARYADLVVIGQFNPTQPSPFVTSDFPAYVILNSARPVLIVPYAGEVNSVAQRVLLSWDASQQAARAVSAALPLLKRAEAVHVIIFDPEQNRSAHGEQPGAELVSFLERHGVHSNVLVRPTGKLGSSIRPGDVGDALLSLATDLAADLLVMGAYGHSRFRETIMGGVTRTVLETMTIPVLMTH